MDQMGESWSPSGPSDRSSRFGHCFPAAARESVLNLIDIIKIVKTSLIVFVHLQLLDVVK